MFKQGSNCVRLVMWKNEWFKLKAFDPYLFVQRMAGFSVYVSRSIILESWVFFFSLISKFVFP